MRLLRHRPKTVRASSPVSTGVNSSARPRSQVHGECATVHTNLCCLLAAVYVFLILHGHWLLPVHHLVRTIILITSFYFSELYEQFAALFGEGMSVGGGFYACGSVLKPSPRRTSLAFSVVLTTSIQP